MEMQKIVKILNQLKPDKIWMEQEVDEFKKMYYERTHKMIFSKNPSYPFSMFYDGTNYYLDDTKIPRRTQDEETEDAAQIILSLNDGNKSKNDNIGKKRSHNNNFLNDILDDPVLKEIMKKQYALMEKDLKLVQSNFTPVGSHFVYEYEPFNNETIKVFIPPRPPKPPTKKQKMGNTVNKNYFLPYILLLYGNHDAIAFEAFLKRLDPDFNGKTLSALPTG